MGTKMARKYATQTLAYLEKNLYEIIGKKYGNDIKEEFDRSGCTRYGPNYRLYRIVWHLNCVQINNLH